MALASRTKFIICCYLLKINLFLERKIASGNEFCRQRVNQNSDRPMDFLDPRINQLAVFKTP